MSLADLVRSGVAIAKSVTSDLQADVTLEAWTGSTASGGSTFATAVTLPAIVEMKQRLKKLATGDVVMSRAVVTFLEPVTANGATGRREPIDPRDRITLPDDTTGPILDVEGMVDAETDAPYMSSVFLG